MWQRFTERARRVVFFAQEEAGKWNLREVSPEHLLLGLVREGDSVAARILDRMGLSLKRIRTEIEKEMVRSKGEPTGDMQLSESGKRIIELAYDEARLLSNNYTGTEHLLLGILREETALAGQILRDLGGTLDLARTKIKKMQDNDGTAIEPKTPTAKPIPIPPLLHERIESMWQRFTERARRLVFFAQEEAGKLGENYVSTEHLLLGLIREDDSVAARILDRMDVSLNRIRTDIERQVTRGDGRLGQDMQLTPRAKRVIDLAYDEARQLSNNYIGTEHVLLGLIREGEGLAGRVLSRLGVTLERTRKEVMDLQDNDPAYAEKLAEAEQRLKKREAEAEQRLQEREAEIDLKTEMLEQQTDMSLKLTALRERINVNEQQWRKKSCVSLFDVSTEQFRSVLEVAAALKALDLSRSPGIEWKYPRTLAMIFEKPSLRTRVSFETAMTHLRGHAINLSAGEIGIGSRESVADVAEVLSRWVDIISARVFSHETVVALAENGTVPVINALSDREHPIQAFADLLTLQEKKGEPGNNLKLAYVGDGNNVLHALLLACAKMGVHISAGCPAGYEPLPEYVAEAQRIAAETGATVTVVSDPVEAVKEADAVYTDVWTSMGQEEEKAARLQIFQPYQVNSELLKHAKPDVIVLHCLPAHRGEEISEAVMTVHSPTIYEQAENRLHTQKALLALIIGL